MLFRKLWQTRATESNLGGKKTSKNRCSSDTMFKGWLVVKSPLDCN